MKFMLLTIAMLSAKAMACPDITGVYMSADGVPVKYVQQGCQTLTRYLGEVDNKGAITFPSAGMFYIMNGKPNCGIRNFCTSVTPAADRLEFKLNFQSGVVTDEHGQCAQHGYNLSLDKDGNLLADYEVTNCTDKFSGSTRKTSHKL